MSWVGRLPGLFHKQDAHTQTGSSLPILPKHMKTETNPTTRARTSAPWEYKRPLQCSKTVDRPRRLATVLRGLRVNLLLIGKGIWCDSCTVRGRCSLLLPSQCINRRLSRSPLSGSNDQIAAFWSERLQKFIFLSSTDNIAVELYWWLSG